MLKLFLTVLEKGGGFATFNLNELLLFAGF